MADYGLSYDPASECVHVVFTGTVDLRVIQQAAPQVARLCEEKGCRRILNDMSRACMAISVADAFESPGIMEKAHISRSIRRALVVPPDFRESEFLETLSQNRGHILKVFSTVEEAWGWLRQES